MQGIVLFAHGSRDPMWARPFEAIRAMVADRRPELLLELAYLERMSPTLPEAVDCLARRGATAITLFPLFLGQGGHVRDDLPRLVGEMSARHPGLSIALEGTVGEAPDIHAAIAGWVDSRLGER